MLFCESIPYHVIEKRTFWIFLFKQQKMEMWTEKNWNKQSVDRYMFLPQKKTLDNLKIILSEAVKMVNYVES